jgi:hypothetical protein
MPITALVTVFVNIQDMLAVPVGVRRRPVIDWCQFAFLLGRLGESLDLKGSKCNKTSDDIA